MKEKSLTKKAEEKPFSTEIIEKGTENVIEDVKWIEKNQSIYAKRPSPETAVAQKKLYNLFDDQKLSYIAKYDKHMGTNHLNSVYQAVMDDTFASMNLYETGVKVDEMPNCPEVTVDGDRYSAPNKSDRIYGLRNSENKMYVSDSYRNDLLLSDKMRARLYGKEKNLTSSSCLSGLINQTRQFAQYNINYDAKMKSDPNYADTLRDERNIETYVNKALPENLRNFPYFFNSLNLDGVAYAAKRIKAINNMGLEQGNIRISEMQNLINEAVTKKTPKKPKSLSEAVTQKLKQMDEEITLEQKLKDKIKPMQEEYEKANKGKEDSLDTFVRDVMVAGSIGVPADREAIERNQRKMKHGVKGFTYNDAPEEQKQKEDETRRLFRDAPEKDPNSNQMSY